MHAVRGDEAKPTGAGWSSLLSQAAAGMSAHTSCVNALACCDAIIVGAASKLPSTSHYPQCVMLPRNGSDLVCISNACAEEQHWGLIIGELAWFCPWLNTEKFYKCCACLPWFLLKQCGMGHQTRWLILSALQNVAQLEVCQMALSITIQPL